MGLFNVRFRSRALNRDVTFYAILPDERTEEPYKTLYLLHGMHGDAASWTVQSAVNRYAAKYRIAVIMPDGQNSFYSDMAYGEKFETYTAKELVEYTRSVFPLSRRREDTFIAGLSMGGYGAFRLAVKYPETFCAAASLSGAIDMAGRLDGGLSWKSIARAIWGEDYENTFPKTDANILNLLRDFPKDKEKPYLYAACGRQDSLYGESISFGKAAEQYGFDFTFEEGDGRHTWDFWDAWLPRALEKILPPDMGTLS